MDDSSVALAASVYGRSFASFSIGHSSLLETLSGADAATYARATMRAEKRERRSHRTADR